MISKEFKTMTLDQLVPYENNPRINDIAVEDVIQSMKQTGNIDPIEVDENGIILSGHTRLKALEQLGYNETEVLVVSGLSEKQKRKYRILANKAAEKAQWDFEKLTVELDGLDFEGYDFDFDSTSNAPDWFDRSEKDGTSREEGNDEYNEFVEKFEPKKTTDDCYTPDLVYDAIADWVAEHYGLNRSDFVRPFYPGGDYQKFKYKKNSVVVDNPPFSILAEIKAFYREKGIKYFLFAPHLTLFSSQNDELCFIPVGAQVVYENGANVNTSFITNLESEYIVRNYPDLFKVVDDANKRNQKEQKTQMRKYVYPDYVMTATNFHQFSRLGIKFDLLRKDAYFIRGLDAQKDTGDAIFGSGFLISEREKAEREKAEREKVERWELSEREMEIIRNLGKE